MSVSHERKVKGYLKPKNDVLFNGYVAVEGLSRSESLNVMIEFFFKHADKSQREKYLEFGQRVMQTKE